MHLRLLDGEFAVCQLSSLCGIDYADDFVFIAKTDEELSLVCRTGKIPNGCIKNEAGWKALKIEGVLDFSLIGVISAISSALAENKIPVFVVSTYNTDYILVKTTFIKDAMASLRGIGCTVIE